VSRGTNSTDDLPDFRLVASVAVSVVAMTFLGTHLVALFYAVWLPWAVFRPKQIFQPSRELLLPAIIVAYSLASVLWSVHPDLTARAALEFASMIGCTVIIARLVSVASFIKGVVLGVCAVLVIVLVQSGGFPEGSALTGSLGSKNQVGAIAELGCYCALLMWFGSKGAARIVLSIVPLCLCLVCLYFSHSATSDISFAAMLCVSYAAYFVGRLPAKFRGAAFSFVIVCMVLVAVAGAAFDWQAVGLKAVGKDVTLTGRTFLWGEGLETGMQNPVLGVGYAAFWVPGTLEAEKLWFHFDITGRTGFHFHNLFINLFVELGAVGCVLWSLLYLSMIGRATGNLLKNGHSVESIFYVGISFMYLVRALTEVDTSAPYGFAPLTLFFVAIRVAAIARRKRPDLTIDGSTSRRPSPFQAGAAIGD
jgi:exopolysaccharide production protein ExoQ